MPGIIDTHSHQAVQGGVNEATLSVVPEVRVKDVVTGDDPGIYLALAGGTTAARLLHGSANTIGGQDAVIKHKPGMAGSRPDPPRRNPQGVKFALGENVTRRTGRFPNTRMGVEAVIERAFEEGRAYRAGIKAYELAKANGQPVGPPIRRDLRLEALADILDGSIKIHSHCYRSDEILMLLRVALAVWRPGPVAPARPRRVQGRRRDHRPRRQRLDLLRLVGLQDRGVRRHPRITPA